MFNVPQGRGEEGLGRWEMMDCRSSSCEGDKGDDDNAEGGNGGTS